MNPQQITLKQLLETTPPNVHVMLVDAWVKAPNVFGPSYVLNQPVLELYCDTCNDYLFFTATQERIGPQVGGNQIFQSYQCRNCQQQLKTFALILDYTGQPVVEAIKLGEIPAFGPRIPAKALGLSRYDQELLKKGIKAESDGLGLGAFAYYRQILEGQKKGLFEEMARVAEKTGSSPEQIDLLRRASRETQFKTAVELVKDAVPEVLRIDGQNPLLLLHSVLSDGLHQQGDQECLQIAMYVRILLAEICDRILQVVNDQGAVTTAMRSLLDYQRKRAETKKQAQVSAN